MPRELAIAQMQPRLTKKGSPDLVPLRVVVSSGEYLVTYLVCNRYLHSEYIQFGSKERGVTQKFILLNETRLMDFDFSVLHLKVAEDFDDVHIDF